MNEKLKNLIDQLEHVIQSVRQSNDQEEFENSTSRICDELEGMDNSLEAVEPILKLIEINPDLNYGGPGQLAHFVESYYRRGYEELLLRSIKRSPSEYTLYLLHRLINDEENPNRHSYIELMKTISLSTEHPQNIVDCAKESLSYFK